MSADTTLLLQGEAARREIRSVVRQEVEAAMREYSGPVQRLYELLAGQRGVLTLARCADLLGVSPPMVSEVYVAKKGLLGVRLGRNSAPLFLIDEVIARLRAQDASRRAGRGEGNAAPETVPS